MTPLGRGLDGGMSAKPDADRIRAIMRDIPAQLGLTRTDHRYGWPQNVYRFDHVTSIAEVLRCGRLYSRQRADELGVLRHDAANPEIIHQSKHAHRYVRLYFGPRTPMQYNTEGIRPQHAIEDNGAHCPVPVFLLFDGPSLLGCEGVEFSNGNLAVTGAEIGSNADFLEAMPWDMIYHRGYMPSDAGQKALIKLHRHAEVLVEDELELEFLREVVCRTGPERETLLSLLGTAAHAWEARIRVSQPGEDIFERRFYHIDDVQLVGQDVVVRSRYAYSGPFHVAVHVRDIDTRDTIVKREVDVALRLGNFKISLPSPRVRIAVEIRVEGFLAYSGVLGGQQLYGAHSLFGD